MLSDIPAEQLIAVIERTADAMLLEAAIDSPPVDALELAERLELVVASDSRMESRARFVRLGGSGGGAILLADDPRLERRQWAVAHELGEWAAHRVFADLHVPLVDVQATSREPIASQLASCLLLPKRWFALHGEITDWDLLELKRIFSTASHELIARRMLAMVPPVIITLFDQGSPQWRLSNDSRIPDALIPAESVAWREAFEFGQPVQSQTDVLPERIATIRCWPIHEPGWRREIMRTELRE